ncbi:hypothetical protein KAR91_03315 [Candidatus Pacearchaeota archaeon]|nr:hypothetical protein [Candidatus Pacearchaeota archaeon]
MIKKIAKHELFIVVGFIMTVLTLIKLFGVYDFSSDWLWFVAGMGLIVEGSISLNKQKMFDRKYRVVLRE